MYVYNNFAHWLSVQMCVCQFSQKSLSERLDISQACVSNWIRSGSEKIPNGKPFVALARLFSEEQHRPLEEVLLEMAELVP